VWKQLSIVMDVEVAKGGMAWHLAYAHCVSVSHPFAASKSMRRMNTHLLHPRSDLTGSALEKREELHEFVTQELCIC
jgi:hypothetical protein